MRYRALGKGKIKIIMFGELRISIDNKRFLGAGVGNLYLFTCKGGLVVVRGEGIRGAAKLVLSPVFMMDQVNFCWLT